MAPRDRSVKDPSRRDFLRIGAVGAATAALGSLGLPESLLASAADGASRPNIIVILSDDHGYGQLGCQGCKDIPTPHIDSIASNGVRFTSGYVTCPVCSPTRAGLLTGRYQQRFGHEFNPAPVKRDPENFGLPLDELTIAERLKKAGYATGLVGKWHVGFRKQFRPMQRGFDEFFGFIGAEHSYLNALAQVENPIWRGEKAVDEKEYLTDAFSREAVSFIGRHAKKPFFLYLAFNAVHSPLEAPDKYLNRFPNIESKKRRTYAAMLSAMDDAVGAVLAELRKNKLEENTLVFFLGDNGSPEGYGPEYNTPLRGYKTDVYEGGIRIPYLVQWKGKLPAGKVYHKPVSSLDIHRTALAAAGVSAPTEKKLDGVDLRPYLNGGNPNSPHETLCWRIGKRRAIRHGDYKLVWQNSETPSLYNLSTDISETTDLSTQQPEKVKELQGLYDKWNAQMIEPKYPQFISPQQIKARSGLPVKREAGDD